MNSAGSDYAGSVAALAALVRIEAELGVGITVGVGIPGTLIAGTGLVKNVTRFQLERLLQSQARRPERKPHGRGSPTTPIASRQRGELLLRRDAAVLA